MAERADTGPFERAFGREPAVAVRAPGRVNWIGEHTDYEEGLVLPCAIDLDTVVLAAPAADGVVHVQSERMGEARFACDAPTRAGDWADYVRGVVWALGERGARLGGAKLWIGSDVPPESGLSSSAALGVACAFAFDRLFGLELGARELALAAHRGENGFVGVGCGILDPFASALCGPGELLRIDCRDQAIRPVPLGGAVSMLVAHSGVPRRLAASGYETRVQECGAALAAARDAGIADAGARTLRDLSVGDLPALEAALPEGLFRRARHVVSENARVDAVAEAAAAGEYARVGAHLDAGQASLRDDYDVSVPELDALCALAAAIPGVHGSRLTGAGFGGCTLHLVEPAQAQRAAEALAEAFASRFGRRPPVWPVRPGAGAGDRSLG